MLIATAASASRSPVVIATDAHLPQALHGFTMLPATERNHDDLLLECVVDAAPRSFDQEIVVHRHHDFVRQWRVESYIEEAQECHEPTISRVIQQLALICQKFYCASCGKRIASLGVSQPVGILPSLPTQDATSARALAGEAQQEESRRRPVRSIFSDQPVSVLGPARRQSVARRR
jgi:hypothetical protein